MGLVTSKEFDKFKKEVVLKEDLVSNADVKKLIFDLIESKKMDQLSGNTFGKMKISGGEWTRIPITYIKTGKSIMMWGEGGTSENMDSVEIEFSDLLKLKSAPVVNITLTGKTGNSSFSYGLQMLNTPISGINGESITTTNITPNGFVAQSFGASGSRFTWFASGLSI